MTTHDGNKQPPGHLAEPSAETRIAPPRSTDHHRHVTTYNKQNIESQTFATDTAEYTDCSSKVHVIDNAPLSVRHSMDQSSAPTRITGTIDHAQSSTLQKDSVDVGTILKDRFVLEDIIARGGMGVVYKARDLRKEEYKDRDPYVAVKVLGEECKTHPDFFMALQRETRKSQKLAHPNIVTVYDFDCDGDTVFMTMEYLVGQTLNVFIRDNQPHGLNNKTAFSIIEGIGQGLAYAHKNGIVHCDFKPGNVFLTKDGTVKILDFGISRATKHPEQRTQDTTVFDAGKFGALTPPYASCEMLEGDDPDPRDDIYALACVAYELLTGSHPFAREKATVARNRHMKPARVKGLHKHQWKGLLHGLAFNRTSRTPSVDQFLRDIDGGYQFLGLTHGWQMIAGLTLIFLVSGAFSIAIYDSIRCPTWWRYKHSLPVH